MSTIETMAGRISEIDGLLGGIPDDMARQQAPGLWRERAQLRASIQREEAEAEAVEQARLAAEDRARRAEEFPAKLAEFHAKVSGLGSPIEQAAEAVVAAIASLEAARGEYRKLQAEAREVGVKLGSLPSLAGISDRRHAGIMAGAQLLRG